jgi:hypothetical protein
MKKVYFGLVDLSYYVNTTLTNAAGKAASALALPTNLVRQEDGVGIQASSLFHASSSLFVAKSLSTAGSQD